MGINRNTRSEQDWGCLTIFEIFKFRTLRKLPIFQINNRRYYRKTVFYRLTNFQNFRRSNYNEEDKKHCY